MGTPRYPACGLGWDVRQSACASVTQTSGVANALLPHGLFQHATPPAAKGLLSASPGTPIPAQEIQSRQIEIGSRLHLTRLCQALCSATAHLLFRLPISFTGGELRERASARDLPRSRLSATYPPRIRCDTARCGGAGPAPPRRLTCDLPRCPRRAPARGGGTDAALLRGLTRPRASAAPTTLRRP